MKKGLGRGLSALIPVVESDKGSLDFLVEVGKIVPNQLQPRRLFDEARIEELAASIREKGIIQPLVVRPNGNGYELVAGERRLRAAMKAGLKQVPVVVREVTDNEALQLALIENLQREDLNPIEEASAYQRLQEELDWSQEEIAVKVGKSRPAVANSMRLLLLPKEIQEEVTKGNLHAGQARALLGLVSEALMISSGREVVSKGLSTRETERLVGRLKSGKKGKKETHVLDPNLRSLIERLQRSLGTKVRLVHKARSSKGKIEIEYYSAGDLERIIGLIIAPQS